MSRRRGIIGGGGAEKENHILCFTAERYMSTVALTVTGTPTQGQSFEYSTDEKATFNSYTIGTDVTLTNVGDSVYFRGNNTTVSESHSTFYRFVMQGLIAGSGDVTSLLNGEGGDVELLSADYAFAYIFAGCTSLTTAPALPATDLGLYCYNEMFNGCTSLYVSDTQTSEAPYEWSIPENGTASGDYTMSYMFSSCLGTRSTDSPNFNGIQKTYYTQNPPV